MELILSVPGIGLITGITFLIGIEDIKRFPRYKWFTLYTKPRFEKRVNTESVAPINRNKYNLFLLNSLLC